MDNQPTEFIKKTKILISTGIYPPQIGGPSEYSKNLKNSLENQGLKVSVKTYGKIERFLPMGLRHLYYFLKILPSVISADYVISLDTFSVGFPTMLASKIFRKKNVIRTGGDFLWEAYVERTTDLVLLRDFYKTSRKNWNYKERMIFKLTNWTLRNVSAIIFSTEWQQNIFNDAYDISKTRQFIIENFYGPREQSKKENNPAKKVFIAGARPLKWKNLRLLQSVFEKVSLEHPEVVLDMSNLPYPQFLEKIRNCYAVALVSLGDISPNMILGAIRVEAPFILTKETGLYDRLKDVAIFVDPRDEKDIYEKIIWLLDEKNYLESKNKISRFNFEHSWGDMAREFIDIYKNI